MERLTGGARVPDALRGSVLALGNFDGFHQGHQTVVARAVEYARKDGRPVMVATFDPHPVRFFKPEAPPFALTSIDQRARLFAKAGADAMLIFRFDADLARLSSEEFVRDLLIDLTGASHVVTGEDYTFSKDREGNVSVLESLGIKYGIETEAVPPVCDDQGPISSSRIRNALKIGDCDEAARLLTRPFTVQAPVQQGDKIGRTWGFPTANLALGNYLRAAYGVYAVRGHLPDGRALDGAANLGVRPQFDVPKELLEPHFFDFTGDLYDQVIEVELASYIRPEARFDGFNALIAQIGHDCEEARRRLSATAKTA
jgi:riboflavin kinase/FMN adenylyltransferase